MHKDGPLGETVFEVMQEKHPAQRTPDRTAFIPCDNLPPLEHVDVTSAHIEMVARSLRGGAGPSGTGADQWKAFLLRYGKASERLREAVASSTRLHANQVVPWDDIRALCSREEGSRWTSSQVSVQQALVKSASVSRPKPWR